LRVERQHAFDIFRGPSDAIRTFDGACALAKAGYYPFYEWKPGSSSLQPNKDTIAIINALEAVNRIPRWLLVVDHYQNPPKPKYMYSWELRKTSQAVPQPKLLAAAQAAAREIDADKLDEAATRIGLTPDEWNQLKSKYLANGLPTRAPDIAGSSVYAGLVIK